MDTKPENILPARNLDGALKREALLQVGVGLGTTIILGWLAVVWAEFPSTQIVIAGLLFVLFMGCILLWLPEHAPYRRLGAANRITVFRAALVANLAAATAFPTILAAHELAVTAIMLITYALDGVDGWVARRLSISSRFGARLDQELDALFTMTLSLAIFRMEIAGAWILLAGGWHYFFHGLRGAFPAFRNALPFSQRRRTICGTVVASLIASASPLLPPDYSEILALAAVVLLSTSFLIDIVWLWRLYGPSRRCGADGAAQQKQK